MPPDADAMFMAPPTARAAAEGALQLPHDKLARVLEFCDWLLGEARVMSDVGQVIEGIALRLRGCGVPVQRMATFSEVRHSENRGVAHRWEEETGHREILFQHSSARTAFAASPINAGHVAGKWIRLHLANTPDEPFPIVKDLKDDHFTDYLCVPVRFGNGMKDAYTFATRAPSGFSVEDIAILSFMVPALSASLELISMRRVLSEVTRIYLGVEPANRVLSGDVQRGDVVEALSVVMFTDMRRFTDISMGLTTDDTVRLLNLYYDCVVGPVESAGGEVLKFMGDGVLAIFRVGDIGEVAAARRSFDASFEALRAVQALNDTGNAPARVDVGVGLHFGIAAYGNVGSGERQDYTVIGRDVNIASRIAGLCSTLSRPLLTSGAFASLLAPGSVTDIGLHPLKGVREPTLIFAPDA
jgi:adenylate cyclase